MKTILITGATSGIGLATAKKFANKKNQLILCGRRQHKLDEISNEISKITNVLTLRFDVSDKKEVNKVLENIPGYSIDIFLKRIPRLLNDPYTKDMSFKIAQKVTEKSVVRLVKIAAGAKV